MMILIPEKEKYNRREVISEEITADIVKTDEIYEGTDLRGHKFKLFKQDKYKENYI